MSPKKAQPLPFSNPDQKPTRRTSRKYRDEEIPQGSPQEKKRDPAGSILHFLILFMLALLVFRMFNQPKPKIPKGTAAPRFVLVKMEDTKRWKPALQNKITVLHFWATWCPSCVRGLAKASKRAKILQERGIQYLLISTDMQMPTDDLKSFLRKQKIPTNEWARYHLGPRAAAQYKIRVLPSVVVIGPDAKIAHYAPGGLSDGALRQLIQKIKNTPKSSKSAEFQKTSETANPSKTTLSPNDSPKAPRKATKTPSPSPAQATPSARIVPPSKAPTSQPTSRSLRPTSQPR